jgi:hypothetical protein
VGSKDVIKQYDTLPSTVDGNAYRFSEIYGRFFDKNSTPVFKIYACMYDVQST